MIYTLTKDALTIFIAGKPHQIHTSHQNFHHLLQIVKGELPTPTDAEIITLANTRTAVESALSQDTSGRVRLGANEIIIDGIPVHSHSTDRILGMLKEGLDIAPWITFMERLIENPSHHVFEELMEWMLAGNMPVTPDGHFLAYKKVDDNLQSYHASPDGTHLQHVVGEYVSMPRYQVDDVRTNTCSTGLHFASWDYLPHYHGSQGKVLLLQIDPADVVSIPVDYNHTKGRAAKYKVLSVMDPKDVEFAFNPYESTYVYTYEDEDDDNTNVNLSTLPDGAQVVCTSSYFDDGTFTEGEVYTVYNGMIRTDDHEWSDGEFAEFELVSEEPLFQAVRKVANPRDVVLCVAVCSSEGPYKAGQTYVLDYDGRIPAPDGYTGWSGDHGAWIRL